MLLGQILDRNVLCYPKKEALVFNDIRYSYREFGEMADRLSNALIGLGVRPGDRVALLAKNIPEYLIAYFGVFQVGGVIIPLNWRLKPREFNYILNQSDSKVLMFGSDFLDMVKELKSDLKDVEQYIMVGGEDPGEGIHRYEKLMADASSEKPKVEVHEGDVAIQMYTSGTTGKPKGALLTHRNLMIGAFMGILSNNSSSESRGLVVAPIFHIAATVFTLSFLLPGGTIVVMDLFDPVGVLKTFEQEKISGSFFAPTMLQMMVNVPDVEKYDFSSLNTLAFGGAPMDYALLLECRRVFQCDFLQGFGQTEASPHVCTMSQQEYREIAADPKMEYKLKAVGKDAPGVEVRIVDDKDNDVPVGEVGEIVARGDNIMIGYYKMPEATEETLRGGWLHTGDMGRFDEDRYLYLADRKKDMIISGGENIYSQEIENIIMEIPGVMETAVIGKPDEKWGEIPKAFVAKAENSDLMEEDVIAYCKENMASFKCPKEVEFLRMLPRNAAGKILKRNLREDS